MKQLLYVATASLLLWQCAEPTPEAAANTPLVSATDETLAAYALSETDSVYCVTVSLSSDSSLAVNYVVNLTYEGQTYRDSLIVTLPAGETVKGQLIFAECYATGGPKPTFTSSITPID